MQLLNLSIYVSVRLTFTLLFAKWFWTTFSDVGHYITENNYILFLSDFVVIFVRFDINLLLTFVKMVVMACYTADTCEMQTVVIAKMFFNIRPK